MKKTYTFWAFIRVLEFLFVTNMIFLVRIEAWILTWMHIFTYFGRLEFCLKTVGSKCINRFSFPFKTLIWCLRPRKNNKSHATHKNSDTGFYKNECETSVTKVPLYPKIHLSLNWNYGKLHKFHLSTICGLHFFEKHILKNWCQFVINLIDR